jgi:hypothetical protein
MEDVLPWLDALHALRTSAMIVALMATKVLYGMTSVALVDPGTWCGHVTPSRRPAAGCAVPFSFITAAGRPGFTARECPACRGCM